MQATKEQLETLFPFQLLKPASLSEAVQVAEVIDVSKDSVIFKRGVCRELAHWLISGSVDLVDDQLQTQTFEDSSLKPLEEEGVYTCTAIATSDARLVMMPQDTLDLILTVNQASNEDTEDWMSRLLSSRLFEFVPPANIQTLFDKFSPVVFSQGDQVIRQGESGDYFYVIKRGRASIDRVINKGQSSTKKHLVTIGTGAFFGEDALISNKKRNATVTMLSNGELMRLGKADFNDLLVEPVSEYVTRAEIEAVIAGGEQQITLIDVRHPSEIDYEITDTKNIPLQLLRKQAEKLDPNTVYVVDTPGRRAELGALLLTQAGFDSYILKHE